MVSAISDVISSDSAFSSDVGSEVDVAIAAGGGLESLLTGGGVGGCHGQGKVRFVSLHGIVREIRDGRTDSSKDTKDHSHHRPILAYCPSMIVGKYPFCEPS